MNKTVITANALLEDSWTLAKQVLDSGWRPDALLALWRGGAFPGVAVHEYLKTHGLPDLRHYPVICSSYTGVNARENTVTFAHADSIFASLAPGANVLVVDDIFDTGHTAFAVRARLEALSCVPRVACVYWNPAHNQTPLTPDYHVRQTSSWIVFPHELDT